MDTEKFNQVTLMTTKHETVGRVGHARARQVITLETELRAQNVQNADPVFEDSALWYHNCHATKFLGNTDHCQYQTPTNHVKDFAPKQELKHSTPTTMQSSPRSPRAVRQASPISPESYNENRNEDAQMQEEYTNAELKQMLWAAGRPDKSKKHSKVVLELFNRFFGPQDPEGGGNGGKNPGNVGNDKDGFIGSTWTLILLWPFAF